MKLRLTMRPKHENETKHERRPNNDLTCNDFMEQSRDGEVLMMLQHLMNLTNYAHPLFL